MHNGATSFYVHNQTPSLFWRLLNVSCSDFFFLDRWSCRSYKVSLVKSPFLKKNTKPGPEAQASQSLYRLHFFCETPPVFLNENGTKLTKDQQR